MSHGFLDGRMNRGGSQAAQGGYSSTGKGGARVWSKRLQNERKRLAHNFLDMASNYHMTDADMAHELGVSIATIGKWRSGYSLPSRRSADVIVHMLKVWKLEAGGDTPRPKPPPTPMVQPERRPTVPHVVQAPAPAPAPQPIAGRYLHESPRSGLYYYDRRFRISLGTREVTVANEAAVELNHYFEQVGVHSDQPAPAMPKPPPIAVPPLPTAPPPTLSTPMKAVIVALVLGWVAGVTYFFI